MDRQQRLHLYSLAAHRLAVKRLREQPARLGEALEVLRRWRALAGGPSNCDTVAERNLLAWARRRAAEAV